MAKSILTNTVSTKSIPTNFTEKNMIWKTKIFYILLAFLLINIILLIVFSNYCYLIKYQTKQKHLLLFYSGSNKGIDIKNMLQNEK